MILIVSSSQDDHAKAVIDTLEGTTNRVGMLDLSTYPQRLGLSLDLSATDGSDFRLVDHDVEELPLAECHVVWWRRPQPIVLHPEIQESRDATFAYAECQAAMDGLWSALDAVWVNHPVRDEEAHRKVYQLQIAQEVGFEIPATRVTNSPVAARAFVDRVGPESTVYKAFNAMPQSWRETRILDESEVELLDHVRYAPVIFQEYVPARLDLRITVIGDEVLPAAVYSQETDYALDYRMSLDEARMEAYELPSGVVEKLRSFMDRLGLRYGAIDMRLTPGDEFVFLEINPAGQWRFVEERTDLPLTETFARLLVSNDERNSPRTED
jgi:glutathione synthase/RimK-type ligase-like ATP-grasp enzyme